MEDPDIYSYVEMTNNDQWLYQNNDERIRGQKYKWQGTRIEGKCLSVVVAFDDDMEM